MIILSPQLTLFLILFLPVAGLVIGRIGRSLKRQSTQAQEKLGAILSTIEETLGGIRVIKAFNAEKRQYRKFDVQNEELLDIKNKVNRRRDLASPVSEVLGIAAVVCVLWYGGRLVLRNSFLDPGDFLAYILIFSQVIQPLKSLSAASYNIRKGAASVDRIEHLINEEVTIKEIENPTILDSFKDCIEFKNVSFSYGDKVILHDINLKIEKGRTVALVGASGAGKSTLVDLIPRFRDTVKGELLIDGINVRKYSLESLRNHMGIVTQEPILFNDTIANNISLGMENAPHGQIENASRVANAHQFILQKDAGYQTNIGERGNKLSGGEKRRLHLLSILFRNPNFLVLDEPTNDLDLQTLRTLEEFLQDFPGCILIVSHDRYFMDRLVDHLFAFEGDGEIRDFPGNYSQYRMWKQLEENKPQPTQKTAATVLHKENKTDESPKQKISFKEKTEFEKLEKEIPALEKEKKLLEVKLNNGSMEFEKLQETSEKISDIIVLLDKKEMRWLELSEKITANP